MKRLHPRVNVWVAAAIVAFGVRTVLAVDVKIDFDKAFDFKNVKTWDWDPASRGDVKMARTQADNPEAIRQQAEPIIVDAVGTEMKARGLQPSNGAQPDVIVRYFLLLSTNTNAQTMGQFLPATVDWGLPLFAPATQSLDIKNAGSLVLDLSGKSSVVWRGVAQAQIKVDSTPKKRESLLREAVRELIKRFPPKS
jgi:hypothetical protein